MDGVVLAADVSSVAVPEGAVEAEWEAEDLVEGGVEVEVEAESKE